MTPNTPIQGQILSDELEKHFFYKPQEQELHFDKYFV